MKNAESRKNEIKELSVQLADIDLKVEEERRMKKRELIHTFIDDCKNFDSEAPHIWRDPYEYITNL